MNDRERFFNVMNYKNVDRLPLHLPGPWADTKERWHNEGLPREADLNSFLGLHPLKVSNVSGATGLFPFFEKKVVRREQEFEICIDEYGRTVQDFTDHTSMPHWLEFPVKDANSLKKIIEEKFNLDDIDKRYSSEWEQKVKDTGKTSSLTLIDGGCYYWNLRSISGIDGASYLFYDAPELVDELFERINHICLEGIKRATSLVKIDAIGFGEDIAFKTGPLVSPEMFRKFILPRYKRVMETAAKHEITLTWYDSDGDLRQLIPDYLKTGVNTLAPCEVAAGMSCPELRQSFGRELRLIGGIDKREIAKGKTAINRELARHKQLIEEGGFLPGIDHSVSADISFDNYRYYIDELVKAVSF